MINRKPKADTTPRPKPTPKPPVKTKVVSKPKPTPKPPVKTKVVSKPKASKKFISVHVAMHHPFQRILIPTVPPGVQLDRDSWLDSQIGAGLVKEL